MRESADLGRRSAEPDLPTVRLGEYIARDGSAGAAVGLDVDSPHVGIVVGKRGSGKSYTLGVLAEGLAVECGVSPVVLDPMGVFDGLAELADGSVVDPRVRPDDLPPRAWADLLGLDPESGPGALVWKVAAEAANDGEGLGWMRARVGDANAPKSTRRAVANHLDLAASWDVFAADGLGPADLFGSGPTVLDLSGLSPEAMNAVARVVARGVYEARVGGDSVDEVGVDGPRSDDSVDRLPWLLVDEAHAFFEGVAAPAFRTLLTRGRAPGVSFVAATQRPSALPAVALSQADLLVAHRLTAEVDRETLDAAQPSYADAALSARLPTGTGEALVADDVTERTHQVTIRERRTRHGGASPRASDRSSPPHANDASSTRSGSG